MDDISFSSEDFLDQLCALAEAQAEVLALAHEEALARDWYYHRAPPEETNSVTIEASYYLKVTKFTLATFALHWTQAVAAGAPGAVQERQLTRRMAEQCRADYQPSRSIARRPRRRGAGRPVARRATKRSGSGSSSSGSDPDLADLPSGHRPLPSQHFAAFAVFNRARSYEVCAPWPAWSDSWPCALGREKPARAASGALR